MLGINERFNSEILKALLRALWATLGLPIHPEQLAGWRQVLMDLRGLGG